MHASWMQFRMQAASSFGQMRCRRSLCFKAGLPRECRGQVPRLLVSRKPGHTWSSEYKQRRSRAALCPLLRPSFYSSIEPRILLLYLLPSLVIRFQYVPDTMKFTSQLAIAALAVGASAHAVDSPSKVVRAVPNVVRQIATVTGVLDQVGSGIQSLDSAVKGFSGSGGPLTSAANALTSTINQGTSTVSGSQDLSLTDALGLQAPVQALTAKAQTLTNDLLSKRSALEAAGLCETTRSEISDINTASQALIKATVAKVPKAAQAIAQALAAGLTKVLGEAQSDFSTANCVDKPGSGSTSSAPATSAPASTKPASSSPASSSPASSTAAASSAMATTSASGSVYPSSAASSGSMTSGYVAPTTTLVSATTSANGTSSTATPSASTVVTAGAGYLAPAGALAMAMAVFAALI